MTKPYILLFCGYLVLLKCKFSFKQYFIHECVTKKPGNTNYFYRKCALGRTQLNDLHRFSSNDNFCFFVRTFHTGTNINYLSDNKLSFCSFNILASLASFFVLNCLSIEKTISILIFWQTRAKSQASRSRVFIYHIFKRFVS